MDNKIKNKFTWADAKKGFIRHRVSILFAAPFLLLFLTFTVIPVLMAIIISFTNYNILEPATFAGFRNYLYLFLQDDVFSIAVKNTVVFAAVLAPTSFLSCLFVAWMLNEFSTKTRTLLTFVFYAPSLTGAVSTIWIFLFSGDAYGVVNNMLREMGFIQEPVQWLSNPKYAFFMVFIVSLWTSLGTGFLSFIAGLKGIDVYLYEAAAIDGIRNRIQELWYITLPTLRPQLMFAALLSITGSFSIGPICNVLFGFPSPNYSAHTIVLHMMDYSQTRFEMGTACAMAFILFLLMVGTNQVVKAFLGRVGK